VADSPISAGVLVVAQRLVPGASPLSLPDARRFAVYLNEVLRAFDEAREGPVRRGRPADHQRRRLFHRLGDVFEEATEQPFAPGVAMPWVMFLLRHTALATWAAAKPEGVATWIKRARTHAIDIEAALMLARKPAREVAAGRPKRGRKKKGAGVF